jgi:asparagine synthetase B (glutamine-hydrolysing)
MGAGLDMCGIAGYVSESGTATTPLVARMCDRIAHRGPDGEGFYCDGPAALGHRRLSIIDVAAPPWLTRSKPAPHGWTTASRSWRSRLPQSFKVRGMTGKFVFKQAVSPYIPGQLVTWAKMGFAVPLAQWFRGSLRPTFETLVLSEGMERFVSLDTVRKIWREHQSGVWDRSRILYNLLMLGASASTHLDSADIQDMLAEKAVPA